jgi:putative ABC transport system ATP-binding protein
MSVTAKSVDVRSTDCLIEARDVVFDFGETPALRGATVSIREGEILAVMGPSGSGKSTLLHCLAGILAPKHGEIRFSGQRVDTLGENERSALRRDAFGFVFQFGQLVPELTAEENVALPLLLSGLRRNDALRRARALFERLGIDGLERRRSGLRLRAVSSRTRRCSSPTSRPDRSTR